MKNISVHNDGANPPSYKWLPFRFARIDNTSEVLLTSESGAPNVRIDVSPENLIHRERRRIVTYGISKVFRGIQEVSS